ncbi:hypothetical protein Hanom_Chr04g00331121 [Helianthus anomalus]
MMFSRPPRLVAALDGGGDGTRTRDGERADERENRKRQRSAEERRRHRRLQQRRVSPELTGTVATMSFPDGGGDLGSVSFLMSRVNLVRRWVRDLVRFGSRVQVPVNRSQRFGS